MTLVFSLCLPAFASAGEDDLLILDSQEFNTFGNLSIVDYGVNSVSYAVTVNYFLNTTSSSNLSPYSSTMNSSSPSALLPSPFPDRTSFYWKLSSATVAIPAGTLTVSYPIEFAKSTVSTSSAGATVSYDSSGFTVVSDGSTSPILLTMSGSGKHINNPPGSWSSSFEPSDPSVDPDPEPDNPFAGSGSMFGWTGKMLLSLTMTSPLVWYSDGSGSSRIGFGVATWNSIDGEASGIRGDILNTQMLSSLTRDKWKWEIDSETGELKWGVLDSSKGTWADMIYRTSVYNWYWGNKLWSNDTSGSWYGSISSDFSYLNYRVNQILQVLANDEDLKIKDATNSERQWVQDYFENGSDIADSGKYDKLNSTSSAFKDAFAGAPDSSISDGFTAVNDNGYDFWSASVSADINGESSVSTFAAVPYDQQVRDLYSDNFEHIRGGTYD